MQAHRTPEDAIAYLHKVGLNLITATHLIPNLPKEVNNDATQGLSSVIKGETAHNNRVEPATVLHHLKDGADRMTSAGSALLKHQDALANHPYAPTGMLADVADASGTGELTNAVHRYSELMN